MLCFKPIHSDFRYLIFLGVHLLQTQMYCCKANVTTDITLLLPKYSSYHNTQIEATDRIEIFVLCQVLRIHLWTNIFALVMRARFLGNR
jgi:hypothetical protein